VIVRSSKGYALVGIFFASGFSALLYQMIWQRLLVFFGGADVYSVTMIVAAFMAGLGFGSLAGGHLADRLAVRARLVAFAGCELAIAVFAAASIAIYYDFLYVRLGASLRSPLAIGLALFATLLWPTFFMGMSLPLLAKALITRTEDAATRIGILYGFNTLGAAVGSLATVWLLAPTWGFAGTIRFGAVINLACALGALLLAGLASRPGPANAASTPVPGPTPAGDAARGPGHRRWLLLYGLSGFIALSLEIVWFRLLGVVLKSTAFTFGTLLAVYLGGVGLGSLMAMRWAARSPTPARTFLRMQSAIGLYAGLSIAVLATLVDRTALLAPIWTHLDSYNPLDIAAALTSVRACATRAPECSPEARALARLFVALYGIVPAVLVGPPTLLMGACFPFLQKTVQTDLAHLGRRVGWLQAANIVGSLLGAVCTGLLLLHWIGTDWTLRLLVVLSGLFLVFAARLPNASEPPRWALATAVVAVAVIAWAVPGGHRLWAKVHGTTPDRVIVQEDGSGLSVLKDGASPAVPEGKTMVYVDGLGHSWLPYGGAHTYLGALPAMLHPAPREAAVIGLGSGDTVFAIAGRPEIARVDVVEIVKPALHTLRTIDRRGSYPGLRLLLGDPRMRFTFTDGRAFLMRSGRLYDLIEADALRPDSAYAGNLYSLEYFQLLARHLRPGGLAVTWGATPRTGHTFAKAFPHAARFGLALVGSNAPIAFDRAAFDARLHEPAVRDHYRGAEIDIAALMSQFFPGEPARLEPASDRSSPADINTDLFPRDEYLVPQAQP
jgi:spermidine synthase